MSLPGSRKVWFIASILASLLGAPAVCAAGVCDALLRPDEARVQADYSVLQAYMAENADDEYARLKALDRNALAADATYLRFSAEYDASNSPEEFMRRVRTRLRDEAYESRTPELRGLARVSVSDSQIAAWTQCQSGSKSGALLVVASNPNPNSFPIKVAFSPPVGQEHADLVLTLGGGLIADQPTFSDRFDGPASRTYTVKPVPGGKSVTIVANIAGISDDVAVDVTPRVATASVTVCDDLVAVGHTGSDAAAAGLVPVALKESHAGAGKAWAYGCKQVRRVAALQPAADTRADQRTTVSVCDGPAAVTYRLKSGSYVLAPGSKAGAPVMQACARISEREVLSASSGCPNTALAMVCTGRPRAVNALNDILVPGGLKGPGDSYAVLCEGARTQKVCVSGQ
jgi:hypothetical protein